MILPEPILSQALIPYTPGADNSTLPDSPLDLVAGIVGPVDDEEGAAVAGRVGHSEDPGALPGDADVGGAEVRGAEADDAAVLSVRRADHVAVLEQRQRVRDVELVQRRRTAQQRACAP